MTQVVYDEGLRSYKAIAFIQSKSSKPRINKDSISYLLLGATLQKTVLTQPQKNNRTLPKKIECEKLWIK